MHRRSRFLCSCLVWICPHPQANKFLIFSFVFLIICIENDRENCFGAKVLFIYYLSISEVISLIVCILCFVPKMDYNYFFHCGMFKAQCSNESRQKIRQNF